MIALKDVKTFGGRLEPMQNKETFERGQQAEMTSHPDYAPGTSDRDGPFTLV